MALTMKCDAKTALCEPALFAMFASTAAGKTPWQPRAHSLLLIETLAETFVTPGARLVIEVPPRYGKTEAVIYAAVRHLKLHPKENIIYCTYAAKRAYRKSVQARQIFRDFPIGPKLNLEYRSVSEWMTVKGGSFFATGTDGQITGSGANVFVWDDPIKNQQDANSHEMREKIWGYWQWTLSTRLEGQGAAIIIQTRWDEDDPAGRAIKQGWDRITLPIVADENDQLGREVGEMLCEEIHTRESWEKKKIEIGSKAAAALFEQNPLHNKGVYFKTEYFKYYHKNTNGHYCFGEKAYHPGKLNIFQTMDTAASEGEANDYTVILTCGIADGLLFVLDVVREKTDTTRHEQLLADAKAKWNPAFQAVENKTYGTTILQNARRKGAPLRALKADAAKTIRAQTAVTGYEAGTILHPRADQDPGWLAELERELTEFPKGRHDDQVDCVAFAAILREESALDGSDRYDDLL